MNVKTKNEESKLTNEKVKLNETVARNKRFKDQIDVLRKELISAKNENRKIHKNITSTKRDAHTANSD
jgi:hypothetical protein